MVIWSEQDPMARAYALIRPSVSATVRLLAAMMLAYVFVVVLMTASAQSLVIAKLAGKADGGAAIEYSEAYAKLVAATAADRRYAAQTGEARRLERVQADSAQANEEASGVFEDLAAPLRSLMAHLVRPPQCDLPAPTELRPNTLGNILAQTEQCLTDPEATAAVKAEGAMVFKGREALAKAGRDWLVAWNVAQRADRDATAARAEAARLQQVRDGAKDLRGPFAPITVLRDRAALGGGMFVQFPPTLLQIVMAFFSGTFGALLLTLVLVVYPNTPLTLTRPGGNYGERVLLGGLIAVCVYIVLGGGTAVLGSSNAFADGNANFQAFSAIGVLAGMFSDRVAQWLSKRADVFYGDEGSTVRDTDGEAGKLKRVG